jgi:putative oxidoreductase
VSSVLHKSFQYCWRFAHRLGSRPWVVVAARGLLGGVFLLAGFSKLLLPPAEVAALIQQYAVVPPAVTPWIAALLPWLELVSGTALVIGFYTTPAALAIGGQLVGFIVLMLVVLALGVPIDDCGCFGNLGWRETPLQVLFRDLVLAALLVPILVRQREVLSLDAWGEPPPLPQAE